MSLKRTFLFIVTIVLLSLLAACEGGPAVEDAGVVGQEQPTAVAEPVASPMLPPPAVTENGEEDAPEAPTMPVAEEAATSEQASSEQEGIEEASGEAAVVEAEPSRPRPTFPWPADRFGYGVQIHGAATMGDPMATMDAVSDQLGLNWVKIQIEWHEVYPQPDESHWYLYDATVNAARQHGLNLMVSVVGAPAWTRASGTQNGPPDDYGDFAAFLDELLTRYDGRIHAVEVWNEANLDREWSTTAGISPEDYVRFLALANDTIEAHDPNIIVITAGPSPTGSGNWIAWADDYEWLQRALAAGMTEHADCVGVHHNGYNLPPDVTYDEAHAFAEAATARFRGPYDNPHRSWSFKTTLDWYAASVEASDPSLPLCVTEFGWPSGEGLEQVRPGFEYAYDVTLAEQAEYIVRAFNQMRESGDVWLAFLHNFDFGNRAEPIHETVLYSVIDRQGAPRPAFYAISQMEKAP